MTDQRVRISLSDLPLRSGPLTVGELQKVFGGCDDNHQSCMGQGDWLSSTCCPYFVPGFGRLVCKKYPHSSGFLARACVLEPYDLNY